MDFSKYGNCPRCGEQSLEHQDSYCHCVNCLYSNVLDEEVSRLPLELLEEEKETPQNEADFWELVEPAMGGVA